MFSNNSHCSLVCEKLLNPEQVLICKCKHPYVNKLMIMTISEQALFFQKGSFTLTVNLHQTLLFQKSKASFHNIDLAYFSDKALFEET